MKAHGHKIEGRPDTVYLVRDDRLQQVEPYAPSEHHRHDQLTALVEAQKQILHHKLERVAYLEVRATERLTRRAERVAQEPSSTLA